MEMMTITKPWLEQCLRNWEQQARDGDWPRDTSVPIDRVAAESAEHLWKLLSMEPAKV